MTGGRKLIIAEKISGAFSITNHHHDMKISYQGQEREPVIVIDNFVAQPQRLIDDAAMLHFRAIGAYYPGIRADVPPTLVSGFMRGLPDIIAETFGVEPDLDQFESWYSLVITPPEKLDPIQRLPHFDGVEPGRLALLHYLGRSEMGGTSFYRHRSTGFETVTAERKERYTAALKEDVSAQGLPDAAYISGDTEIFSQISHYEAIFNRAIIYRGHTLHCADIPKNLLLSANPQEGRLTVNTFLNCRPRK